MSVKRRDNKNRILRTGESQEADGRYKSRYIDANGKRKSGYSWRPVILEVSMIRVLFVCWGNICRSPMAEFVMKKIVEEEGCADQFVIESSATSSEEIWGGRGNPVYPPAREELARHGISCKGKRAQLLKRSDYDRYDFLIGMEGINIRYMNRILGGDPEKKITKLMSYTNEGGDIDDPWYTGDFEGVYRQIESGCRGLLKYLKDSGQI